MCETGGVKSGRTEGSEPIDPWTGDTPMKKTTHTTAQVIGHGDDEDGIIPFADECDAHQHQATPIGDDADRPCVSDRPDEGAQASPRAGSIVDRDLGLDEPGEPTGWVGPQHTRRYTCPCCGQGATRVVRVRVATQPSWVALCAVCAASMLVRYPGTIVGGMVRPTRRRRSKQNLNERNHAHGFRVGAGVHRRHYDRAG